MNPNPFAEALNATPAWMEKPGPDPIPQQTQEKFQLRQANDSTKRPPILCTVTGGTTAGGGSGDGTGGLTLTAYACSGNMNGEAKLLYLFGPPDQ